MSSLILHDDATSTQFIALGRAQGWQLTADTQRTHTRFRSLSFRSPGGEVHWLEHHGLGVRWLQTNDDDALASLAALPLRSVEALDADAGSEDLPRAMGALNALFLTEAWTVFYPRLAAHAVHPNLWVRRNARYLAGYLHSPQAIEAIRPALADPELGPLWQKELERMEAMLQS